MSNLIPLEDAARMLGLSVDQLNEMRSNSEIFGYKDGTSWKFKMQEIERVADELDVTINVDAAAGTSEDASVADEQEFEIAGFEDDDDELSFELSDSADAILDDSSSEAGDRGDSGELRLEGDEEDEIALVEEPAAESGELSFGSSDIHLASEESGDLLDDDEPGKGDPSTGRIIDEDDDDELVLSEDDLFEDELTIHESHEDSIDLSSDFEDSSDVIIDDSDSSADDELVIEESGNMVAAEEADSSELSLSDSGLIELAEDDEMIVLDEPADLDEATQLQDDDFNLTPLEAADEEESSGSQVIALEDSDMYSEDDAATLLSPSDEMEAEPMLTEDALDVGDFGAFDAGMSGMAPGLGVPGVTQALPESPYSIWQVVSLGLVVFLLLVGGMVGYDLARNLWLPQDQIISGGVLKFILSLVGG